MNREKVISKLKSIPFSMFWPDDCPDVGFTEQEIWVTKNGIGFIECDEPNSRYRFRNISDDMLKQIKEKVRQNKLTWEDLIDTPLSKISEIYDEIEWVDFSSFLDLPEHLDEYFYWYDTEDGGVFFSTEAEMLDFLSDKIGNECIFWDELEDETLNSWYEYIFTKLDAGEKSSIVFETIE